MDKHISSKSYMPKSKPKGVSLTSCRELINQAKTDRRRNKTDLSRSAAKMTASVAVLALLKDRAEFHASIGEQFALLFDMVAEYEILLEALRDRKVELPRDLANALEKALEEASS